MFHSGLAPDPVNEPIVHGCTFPGVGSTSIVAATIPKLALALPCKYIRLFVPTMQPGTGVPLKTFWFIWGEPLRQLVPPDGSVRSKFFVTLNGFVMMREVGSPCSRNASSDRGTE
jgi:hypothetical protein